MFRNRKQRRGKVRIKRRVDDVREGNNRMDLENQEKKRCSGDVFVVNIDTSIRSLDVTLPIIGDLQKQFQ